MPGKSSSPPWSMRRNLSLISCLTVLETQPLARKSFKVEGRWPTGVMKKSSQEGRNGVAGVIAAGDPIYCSKWGERTTADTAAYFHTASDVDGISLPFVAGDPE